MDRNDFIRQVGKHLGEMNVPYQIGNNTDISISATLKKQREDDDSAVLLYFALMFLNQEKNTVFAYEKAMEGDKEISKSPEFDQTAVKTGDDNDPVILLGSVLGGIASIAASMGLSFEKTDNAREASYPPGYIPPKDSTDEAAAAATIAAAATMAAVATATTAPTEPVAETPSTSAPASTTSPATATPTAGKTFEKPETKRFCGKCGAKMKEGARFCPACGADSQRPNAVPNAQSIKTAAKTPVMPVAPARPYVNANSNVRGATAKRKRPVAQTALISVVIIGVLVGAGILGKNILGKKPGSTTAPTTTKISASPTGKTDSAVVSAGVDISDLGNITNGQYYFATDKQVFYSSYDENDSAHIYSANKDGTGHKAIFDGFGWSLVVIDDWLYFSGNQGKEIDGTYTIFRMKPDGSQLEKLNNEYSWGMFFYDKYLYYMKRNPENESLMSICRASLDGKNEEVLVSSGLTPLVYKDQLYYYDYLGNIFRAKPDGKDPQAITNASVMTYVIGGGKLIYNDSNSIYVSDIDGKNNQRILMTQDVKINNVNVYNGRIFYSEYTGDLDSATNGFPYTIRSCKMDGSDDKAVYSSVSYGIYMNVVDNKLMLMDYVRNTSTQIMNAVIKVMNLDGGNQSVIAR